MITEAHEVEQGDDTATIWPNLPGRDATIGYVTAGVSNLSTAVLTPSPSITFDALSEPGLTVFGGVFTTINNFDTDVLTIRSNAALELDVGATGWTVARFSDVGRPLHAEDERFYTVWIDQDITRTIDPLESVVDHAFSAPDEEWDQYLIELKQRYAAMSDTEWFQAAHSGKSLGDVTPVL